MVFAHVMIICMIDKCHKNSLFLLDLWIELVDTLGTLLLQHWSFIPPLVSL